VSGSGLDDGDDGGGPTIQSVGRAARILDAFSVGHPRLSLNEITEWLGTSKATAHRYTKALREAQLVHYDVSTSLYSLGPRVIGLAAAAHAALPILSAAEPYMQALGHQVDETVVLSIFDGETITVVRSVDSTERQVSVAVRPGTRIEPATSAQGRLFCAYMGLDQIPLNQAVRRDSEFVGLLARIRAEGISISPPTDNGMRSIAAPVFEGGRIAATMAIIGTITSVPEHPGSDLARALLSTTRELSSRLGNLPAQ
jgi:DNA-binding IclR family transcriptional regulator